MRNPPLLPPAHLDQAVLHQVRPRGPAVRPPGGASQSCAGATPGARGRSSIPSEAPAARERHRGARSLPRGDYQSREDPRSGRWVLAAPAAREAPPLPANPLGVVASAASAEGGTG